MTLQIGKVIKRLRSESGITQEQLADYLNISYQAVSKWENGIALPDITLIPLIADFFNVSTDVLFSKVDSTEKEIEKILSEASTLNAFDDIEGKMKINLLEDGLFRYPLSVKIMMELVVAYSCHQSDFTKNYDKLIRYANYLKDNSKTLDYKFRAIQILCYVYRGTDQEYKIEQLAKSMPTIEQTQEALLCHGMKGSLQLEGMSIYAKKLAATLSSVLLALLYPNGKDEIELLTEQLISLANKKDWWCYSRYSE